MIQIRGINLLSADNKLRHLYISLKWIKLSRHSSSHFANAMLLSPIIVTFYLHSESAMQFINSARLPLLLMLSSIHSRCYSALFKSSNSSFSRRHYFDSLYKSSPADHTRSRAQRVSRTERLVKSSKGRTWLASYQQYGPLLLILRPIKGVKPGEGSRTIQGGPADGFLSAVQQAPTSGAIPIFILLEN